MSTVERINLTDPTLERPLESEQPQDSRLAGLVRRVPAGWWNYLLLFSDMGLIVLAFAISYALRYQLQWFRTVEPVFSVSFRLYGRFLVPLLLILPLAYYLSDVYPYRRGRSWVEQVYAIATATAVGVMVVIIGSLFFSATLYSRLIFLYAALLITIFLGISRMLIMLVLGHLRRFDIGVERMLLVGAGDVGRMVMRNVVARPDFGYRLIGFIDDHPAKGGTDIGPFEALGPIDNLETLLDEREIETVVVCLPWQTHRTIQRMLRICEQKQVRAQVVPDLFQLTKNQMQVEDLNGIPLISMRDVSIQGWNLVIKRISDVILTLLLSIIALPVGLIIGIAIWLDSRGPIFFKQVRVGKNGEVFTCRKFRSMVDDADNLRLDIADLNEATGPLFKVRDDPRCTRVGRFLRRYSLDELPQLVNVLRGEMSLVGPRPNLPDEVAQYRDWHKKRLSASPGITGLWQVSGRSDLTFDEMVLLDIYYVENWSLALDFNILLRSIPAVILGRGAY